MPLVAVALVVSTLLSAGSSALAPALASIQAPRASFLALDSALVPSSGNARSHSAASAPAAWSSSSAPSAHQDGITSKTEGDPSTVHSLVGLTLPATDLGTVRRSTRSARAGECWVAPHMVTSLWSSARWDAQTIGTAHQWAPFQVVGESYEGLLPVQDPATRQRAWVRADAVGPVDPTLLGTEYLPPADRQIAWGGPARITMYTCVELGGCAPTASGVWPEPGMVAVDPTVIPLGSTVWIQGLGTFQATDTGSLVRGAHLDVFGLSYQDAIAWGVQERAVLVFARE